MKQCDNTEQVAFVPDIEPGFSPKPETWEDPLRMEESPSPSPSPSPRPPGG